MGHNIINAIDIRPDKVVCLISHELEIVNEGTFLQLVGHGIENFPLDCSDPLLLSDIELKNYIISAVKKAEIESGHKVQNAYINIFDKNKSVYIDDLVDIENDKINENDINSFFNKNKFKSLYTDEFQPLHSFPISFRIDSSKSVSDPIGISARKLKTKWHIIISDNKRIQKLSNIFQSINISINQFIANFYSTSLSVLNDMETSTGAITLDIGKTKTFISYTFDNQLVEFQEIPLGTYNISKDLAQLMKLSINDADILRKKINAIDMNHPENRKDIEAIKIFNSRCEELIELIQKKINNSHFSYLVDNNMVISGIGSKSIKIMNQVKLTFRTKKVRLGSTIRFNGLKTIINNPSLSSSFGLLLYSSVHKLELNSERAKPIEKKSIFNQIYKFFKEI